MSPLEEPPQPGCENSTRPTSDDQRRRHHHGHRCLSCGHRRSAGHLSEDTRLVLAILGSVVIYWLAHVHARVVERAHPMSALRGGSAGAWPILAAALLPVGILLIADVAGAPIRTAAWIAVIASTVLLTVYSFLRPADAAG